MWQMIEIIEIYRRVAESAARHPPAAVFTPAEQSHASSNRIAAIFIPLPFIAGVLGMNFPDLPQLEDRWGFPAITALMGGVAGGMLVFFRRRRWICGSQPRKQKTPPGEEGPGGAERTRKVKFGGQISRTFGAVAFADLDRRSRRLVPEIFSHLVDSHDRGRPPPFGPCRGAEEGRSPATTAGPGRFPSQQAAQVTLRGGAAL